MEYIDIYGVKFSNDKTKLVRCPETIVGSYIIPDSVAIIENSAFYACSSLVSITIPNSVTEIGKGAFANCKSLSSINIPMGITSIKSDTFSGCLSLKSIYLPNTLNEIGSYAFKNCSSLTFMRIPEFVTKIGIRAFEGCSSLESVTIPCEIKELGCCIFKGCSSLKQVTIPNEVTKIGYDAFENCSSLTSIVIPKSTLDIDGNIFMGCSNLSSIKVEEGNQKYDSRNNCNAIIETKTNELIAGCQTTLIPNNVSIIGRAAFEKCDSLKSVVIPNSVLRIKHCAFQGCSSITHVEFGNRINIIEEKAFKSCTSLTSVFIPGNVETIESYAFEGCSGLTILTLEIGIKRIDSGAFAHCTSLESIFIPSSVISLGRSQLCSLQSPFTGCTSLSEIVVDARNPVFDSRDNCNAIIETKTNELIAGCKTTIIPHNISRIRRIAFLDCATLKALSIPNNIIEIGDYSFTNCSALESIVIPDNVTCCDTAFSKCTSLKSIVIGNGIKNIYLSGCTSLQSITLPQHITEFSFDGCSSLNSIIIPNSVTNIKSYAFRNCVSLKSISIPNSVVELEYGAFENCSALTNIDLPINVSKIHPAVFYGCSSLSSISLPAHLIEIGHSIFDFCESLQIIRVPKGKKEEYCKLGLEPYRDLIHEPQEEEYTILLNIAKGYEMGIGMTKNLAQAVLIYSQAADKGCAEAAFHLGELYEQGDGLPKDYQQAIEWYTKAIALYHPSAETRKKHCEQVLRDQEQRMDKYQREIPSQIPQFPTTKYIFFDTECNGLPKYYNVDVCITSNWPRLIQLAWIVTDESGNVLKRQSHIIYPQGFNIIEPIAKLTRITTERAQREGVDLYSVLTEFMEDVNDAKLLIAHNIDFDKKVVGCELYRENMDYDSLLNKSMVCTMQKSTNFCAIPSNGNHAGYKWPKLEELHQKLFGTIFSGAHDAMSDVEATRKCYFELKKRGIL